MNAQHPLASYMSPFFNDYLATQRGLSYNSILAYRDALKLLFCFIADLRKKAVDQLTIEDLNETLILAFLDHLEQQRGACAKTRNARLSAIRTFFLFIGREEPALLKQCQQIRSIPQKRKPHKCIDYLDQDELTAIFSAIDLRSKDGIRDRALLLLMFNTGARAQEVVDLKVGDLRLDSFGQVKLLGKGKKQRACPLWQDTVQALTLYLQQHEPANCNDRHLFLNATGGQLSRFGIRYIVKKYADRATPACPSLANKRVGPHTIRHSTAMHLIQAGNDINMVAIWLGHANINTTHLYLEIDLEMKRKMLNQCSPPNQNEDKDAMPWQNDKILNWLDALSCHTKLCEVNSTCAYS